MAPRNLSVVLTVLFLVTVGLITTPDHFADARVQSARSTLSKNIGKDGLAEEDRICYKVRGELICHPPMSSPNP